MTYLWVAVLLGAALVVAIVSPKGESRVIALSVWTLGAFALALWYLWSVQYAEPEVRYRVEDPDPTAQIQPRTQAVVHVETVYVHWNKVEKVQDVKNDSVWWPDSSAFPTSRYYIDTTAWQ